MNRKNLRQIFDRYIQEFEYLNNTENDENMKWRAVAEYRQTFDLNTPDFAGVLKGARKASGNLVDNHVQPFEGLVRMAEKNGEAENIQEMFRALYADDHGDLTARQEKISSFLAACDALQEKHFPGSYLYKNDQRSAMAYLWLYDPDHNYHCKATEAQYLANVAEFYDDWGTYREFRLDVYYRFCDQLVDEMRAYEPLMEINLSRFAGAGGAMYPDPALHILAFDIIYCSQTYDLFRGVEVKSHTAADRALYQQRKEKAADLAKDLALAEESMRLLTQAEEQISALIPVGASVFHRTFGPGTVSGLDEDKLRAFFPSLGCEKQFLAGQALSGGFLRADDPRFPAFLAQYGPVLRTSELVRTEYSHAQSALEPYRDFLD